jgi:GxxExxY protein
MKYGEITGQVIGCAMRVHSYFGWGFPELIYKRSLIIELQRKGLECGAEVERDIYYYEHLVGRRRIDLLVEKKVLVELKATSALDPSFSNQVINYLKVFNIEVGLLLNFGTERLTYTRFVN